MSRALRALENVLAASPADCHDFAQRQLGPASWSSRHAVVRRSTEPACMGCVHVYRFHPAELALAEITHRIGTFDAWRNASAWTDAAGRPRGLRYEPRPDGSWIVHLHEFFYASQLPGPLRGQLAQRVPMATAIAAPVADRPGSFFYEFLEERLIPGWMQAGPGLFEYSAQSMTIDAESAGGARVRLAFAAGPLPRTFLGWSGLDPAARVLRALSALPLTRPLGSALWIRAWCQMVALHDRVHDRVLRHVLGIR